MIVQFSIPNVMQPDAGRGFYVFPERDAPTSSVRHAIAGPFDTPLAARLWIVERLEAELSEPQRETWAKLAQRIGGVTHDLGLELFLLEWIVKGKSFEKLCKYVPKIAPRDWRALAAGELESRVS